MPRGMEAVEAHLHGSTALPLCMSTIGVEDGCSEDLV